MFRIQAFLFCSSTFFFLFVGKLYIVPPFGTGLISSILIFPQALISGTGSIVSVCCIPFRSFWRSKFLDFINIRKRKRDRRYREEKEDERGKQQHLFSYFRRERSRRERVLFDDAQFNDVRLKFAFGDCQHRATESSAHMLTRSAKTHNSRAQECETDPTSQPAHDCRVGPRAWAT